MNGLSGWIPWSFLLYADVSLGKTSRKDHVWQAMHICTAGGFRHRIIGILSRLMTQSVAWSLNSCYQPWLHLACGSNRWSGDSAVRYFVYKKKCCMGIYSTQYFQGLLSMVNCTFTSSKEYVPASIYDSSGDEHPKFGSVWYNGFWWEHDDPTTQNDVSFPRNMARTSQTQTLKHKMIIDYNDFSQVSVGVACSDVFSKWYSGLAFHLIPSFWVLVLLVILNKGMKQNCGHIRQDVLVAMASPGP